MGYVQTKDSAHYFYGAVPDRISDLVVKAFQGRNPERKMVFHVRPHGSLECDNYRYILDFESRFPDADYGKVVYALGIQYSDKDTQAYYMCQCKSPVRVFVNGIKQWQSTIIEETNPNTYKKFFLPLNKGINYILVEVEKVRSGFGCVFGSGEGKWEPHMIFMPGHSREFEEGYAYTAPVDKVEDVSVIPLGEADENFEWFPKQTQALPTGKYVMWTKAVTDVVVSLSECGAVSGYINGELYCENLLSLHKNDNLTLVFDRNMELSFVDERFAAPCEVKGNKGRFFFQNIISSQEELIASHPSLESFFGDSYWQSVMPSGYIRPALESEFFGKWTYPIGVTLTGLLAYGSQFNNREIIDYSLRHINEVTTLYEYMKWDYKVFNNTNFNQLLTNIVMLDDCGSCGSAMLEASIYGEIKNIELIRDEIYEFIVNKHHKNADGILVRGKEYFFMENSIWADDLYMSIPFLCRYYRATGNSGAISFAIKQVLLFKQYLFMEEEKIMAHVHNTAFNASNGIAWGRGNGWTVYSLCELLSVLPNSSECYDELSEFFICLCEGVLSNQDESGMWRQVVNDCASYKETSCTCMFICAFLRGFRLGLLSEEYRDSALKAWEAVCKECIDKEGNIYGICKGSGYSFSPDYYKYELLTNKNDLHGVGILLLAACEVDRSNSGRN